jgi:hypothetical protein
VSVDWLEGFFWFAALMQTLWLCLVLRDKRKLKALRVYEEARHELRELAERAADIGCEAWLRGDERFKYPHLKLLQQFDRQRREAQRKKEAVLQLVPEVLDDRVSERKPV